MTVSIQHRVVIVAAATLLVLSAVGCQQSAPAVDVEQLKAVAGELRETKLYQAAIEEYETILLRADLDDRQRGNINYLIGRVYFEDLQDYANAASYYVRARAYDPEGSYMQELSRNLVTSLERLGQFVDAKRELGAAVDIDTAPRPDGDVPVALIGADTVWLSRVETWVQSMPAQVQQQYANSSQRAEFVRQYVGQELLYRAALREGYDRDPEIIADREMLVRRLYVDRFLVAKVMPEVKIDTLDVRNYYQANRSARYDDAPYDSVRTQVFLDYQAEKAGAVYNDYIGKLVQAEQVTFLDHNLRD